MSGMRIVVPTVGGDLYESCSNCHRKYLDAIVNANK